MSESSAFHIAIFCKAPVEGRVKTRLIDAFGPSRATAIYRQLVQITLQTVADTCAQVGASASLWIADDVTHPEIRQWASDFNLPTFLQQGNDLGARMWHCLRSLCAQHRNVLLIGTDCPALSADDLVAAARALGETHSWVFTPAEDGGYVLVGSNVPTATPFTDIAWSTNQVMAQTRAALASAEQRWAEMPAQWDVDEPVDVERAIAAGLLRPD